MFMPVATELHFCYICSLVIPPNNRLISSCMGYERGQIEDEVLWGISQKNLYEVVERWRQTRENEKSQLIFFLVLNFACYIKFSFHYS